MGKKDAVSSADRVKFYRDGKIFCTRRNKNYIAIKKIQHHEHN